MPTRLIPCAGLLPLVLVAGCQREPAPVPVGGTVTLDGRPLKAGLVYFVVPGEPPTVLDVADGGFAGKVLPGTRRVEFRAYRTVRRTFDPTEDPIEFVVNDLPERYGTGSQLTAEIKEEGANEFAFALTK